MRGSNQSGVRAWNERLVLSLLRHHGALSKAEIARASGLSAQTVSVIMRSLERDGFLRKGDPIRGRIGQPSVPMSLVATGGYFFGLKIGRRSSELVLTDFRGSVVGRRTMRYEWPVPDAIVRFTREVIGSMAAELTAEQKGRIFGLGIAVPFQLWNWAGVIGAPQKEMDAWRDRDIRADLADGLDFPVFLENDATAACGAELIFAQPTPPSDFVYFYIGFFVGGGIVLNGSLHTGQSGNAGALGSMPIPASSLVSTHQGRGETVQLIELASIAVLERQLRVRGMPSAILWDNPDDWAIDPDLLDGWVETVARALAHSIVACISVIDFEAVLIDGWMPKPVRQRIVERTAHHLLALNRAGLETPQLREGTLGADARTLGAACLPLTERFMVDPTVLLKAPAV